jgi:hypothetical protein
MAKASDTYPKRNLPGSSEEWGRRVEGVQKEIDSRLNRIEQSVGIQSSTLANQALINQSISESTNNNAVVLDLTTSTPSFPTNIVVESNVGYWLDDGTARSVVIISFDAVVKDINNRDVVIEDYELWSRVVDEELSFNVSNISTVITYSGWTPGVEVKFALRAKSVYGIASGFSQEITLTPANPANIVPKAPENLEIDSNTGAFASNNAAIATVDISWDAVTESTDDETITVPEYEVWIDDAPYVRTSTNSLQFTSPSGVERLVRVRARSIVNAWGDLSDSPGLSVTGASPATATRAPSDPVLTTAMGILTVSWDGTYVSGGASGAGAVFIEYLDGSTWKVVGTPFSGAGSMPLQFEVGAEITIRLAAYDVLNRLTGRSGEESLTVTGVDTPDITEGFEEWIIANAGGATITVGEDEPTIKGLGDLWFRTNNEGEIINIYIGDGTDFILHSLIGDSLLVANSVTARNLNAEEIFADEAVLNELSVGAAKIDILTAGNIMNNGDIILIANTASTAESEALTAQSLALGAGSAADAAQVTANEANTAAIANAEAISAQQARFVVTSTGASIRTADNTQELSLEPGSISIIQNGVTVSSWNASRFQVDSAIIGSAEIGGHVVEKYSTGRTTFKALTA